MGEMSMVATAVVMLFVGGGCGYWLNRMLSQAKDQAASSRAEEIVASAQREADGAQARAEEIVSQARREAEAVGREVDNHKREAEIQAKDYLFRAKQEFEQESRAERREIQELEKRLLAREESLEKKLEQVDQRIVEADRRAEKLSAREQQLTDRAGELEQLEAQATTKLEEIAGLSAEAAKRQIVEKVEEAARRDSVKIMRKLEEEAKDQAEAKSKHIIASAIQRFAGEYVAERTITVFPLPTDELKGRIIGREGRNIRAIEQATGVDLIVDDTPETVVISCHNPIRREVARRTLESLIADGRIHPTRIEDTVAKMSDEVDAGLKEAGDAALYELGIRGVHPEVVRTLGMLKYRTSYTQNVLTHSMEAAFLCGMMASELGLDPKMARRAALMHDLGKAVTHEVDGPHAMIGGEMAEKWGEPPEVVHAIAAHHEDIPQEGILPVLVQAADAISGARPGARRETLSNYIQRLEDLERIATSFEGIDRSFAIQAGRELRVIVNSNRVDDTKADLLARDIAVRIEDEMQFPGQIKVTVIRETRSTHFAR